MPRTRWLFKGPVSATPGTLAYRRAGPTSILGALAERPTPQTYKPARGASRSSFRLRRDGRAFCDTLVRNFMGRKATVSTGRVTRNLASEPTRWEPRLRGPACSCSQAPAAHWGLPVTEVCPVKFAKEESHEIQGIACYRPCVHDVCSCDCAAAGRCRKPNCRG